MPPTSLCGLLGLAIFLLPILQNVTASAFGSEQVPIHVSSEQQKVGLQDSKHVERVAIIGAGAAGSSTAYHLRKLADNFSVPIEMTIFESADYIGGRSTTINALNDSRYPTELGASIFVQVNRILVDAAAEFNLTGLEADVESPRESKYSLGIWDGSQFAVKFGDGGMSWLDLAKFFWRYSLGPLKAQRLMKSTVGKFLRLYEEPLFPWRSLTEVAAQVGLMGTIGLTGEQYTRANSIDERFSREIIQASTRVNYGQNLGLIHGLETMVCMATEGAMSIPGGNWKIFDGMIKNSGGKVRLNTRVERINRLPAGGYELRFSEDAAQAESAKAVFDSVVIAAPFQFSDIKVTPELTKAPDEIPYVTLYATFLVSPHPLSRFYFSDGQDSSPSEQAEIPEMILTTLPQDLDLGSSRQGVGPTGFWSISTLRRVEVKGSWQYLYKVFSPSPLNAKFVSKILGFNHTTSLLVDAESLDSLDRDHVSWTFEKKWHSYPFEYPRVTFEELNLDGSKLWYTGGMDSFISTMETNALMGKNIASLIVDELKTFPEVLR